MRIGNGAHEQLQLDVFGETADAIFQALKAGMEPSERGRALQPLIAEYLATAWRQPDEGIWEVRGGRQHFVHSKSWRGSHLIGARLPSKVKDSRIRRAAGARSPTKSTPRSVNVGFDPDLNSFVQAYGSKQLDASLLLLPLVGFLPAADPRIKGTLQAIEDRLLIDNEFVLRYEAENTGDGLPAGEGVFFACSFWLVDNYILQGRYAEARKLFDRLLSRCNDVGLLAEELDPLTGRMLGNFPQAGVCQN